MDVTAVISASYCLLSNGIGGKRLTQPYWVQIINRHDGKKNKDDAEIMDVTAVTEGMTAGAGSTKLPWMVEKEQRAAAREAAKAKVEEPKKSQGGQSRGESGGVQFHHRGGCTTLDERQEKRQACSSPRGAAVS